jgi:hypothetical protein
VPRIDEAGLEVKTRQVDGAGPAPMIRRRAAQPSQSCP